MGWIKRDIVEQALEEIGIASYAFDLSSEQMEAGLRRLDTMMAEWNSRGIRLGYPLPSSPKSSDLDQETGVPDAAIEAMVLNLACRIAPQYGRVVSTDTKVFARSALNSLYARAAQPVEMQLPETMPLGAGASNNYQQFVTPPEDTLDAGSDSAIDFN